MREYVLNAQHHHHHRCLHAIHHSIPFPTVFCSLSLFSTPFAKECFFPDSVPNTGIRLRCWTGVCLPVCLSVWQYKQDRCDANRSKAFDRTASMPIDNVLGWANREATGSVTVGTVSSAVTGRVVYFFVGFSRSLD